MSNLEAIAFAAKIQIGSRIKSKGMVMIVTGIGDREIKGISEYAKEKFNKEEEIVLRYVMLLNNHYNDFQIL